MILMQDPTTPSDNATPRDTAPFPTYRRLLRQMDDIEVFSELAAGPQRIAEGARRDYAMENGPERSPEFRNAEAVIDEVERRWQGEEPSPAPCDLCTAECPWEDLEPNIEGELVCGTCRRSLGLVACTKCEALFPPAGKTCAEPRCPEHVEQGAPAVPGPYVATFTPQAWVLDYAITADAEGETTWDCTPYLQELGILAKVAAEVEAQGHWVDMADQLQRDPRAPRWVQDWSGPFAIVVTRHQSTREGGGE